MSEAEWLCYEDLNYGIALEYPASFEVSIPGSAASPKEPEGHARYHKLVGDTGNFELDIWLTSEPDLTAWLAKMRGLYSMSGAGLFPAMEPNATVGGHPAVVFIQEGHHYDLTALFSDGARVYRLQWLFMACEEGGLPTVRRILDSVRTSPEPVSAQIPDDIWQQALRKCLPRDRIGR